VVSSPSPEPKEEEVEKVEKAELSLSPCGPLDRLFDRVGLGGTSPRVSLRAVITVLVTWLPLLVIMLVAPGSGEGSTSRFFHDIVIHVRLLLVVPLLILAEREIGTRTRMVAEHFRRSGLIAEGDEPRFESIVRTGQRRLNSGLAEVLIAVFAYVTVGGLVKAVTQDGTLFWYEDMGPQGERLSTAGWWYAAVSPLVTFLFLRWGWRYLIWSWFLHKMARLDLRIATTHPDHVGGLGFVNIGHTAFSAIGFAASCQMAAAVGNRILNEGAALKEYQSALVVFVVILIIIGLAPLALFSPRLLLAKRRGLIQYGQLATVYIRMFEEKWIDQEAPKDELLGTGDIQTLADLGGGFERLDTMRVFPIDRKTMITFALSAVGPLLPLALTVMPLKDILKLILKSLV